MAHMRVLDRAEVRDGHSLDRRFPEKEEPDRCVRRQGEGLDVLEGRVPLPAIPGLEFREPPGERGRAEPGPLARPARQLGTDLCAEQ